VEVSPYLQLDNILAMEKTSTTAAGFTDEKNSTREGSPANIDKHPALKLAKKD